MTMRFAPVSIFALLFLAPFLAGAQTSALWASVTSGSAPLIVTFTGSNSAACATGSYTLDYGDGATYTVLVPSYACNSSFTVQHTYVAPGTYPVALKAGSATVGTQTITVGGGTISSRKAIDNFIFSYQATSTANPLQTKFNVAFVADAMCDGATYKIDYGDGATANIPSSSYSALCYMTNLGVIKDVTGSFSHTYASAGTYAAKLKRNDQVIESLSVNAGGSLETSLAVSATTGTAPLTVTITTNDAGCESSNDAMSLRFGDATSPDILSRPVCNGSATMQHTYTTAGTYTIRLGDDDGLADTETVVVRPSDQEDESTSGVATCPALTKQLQKGDSDATTGGEVSKLQQFLTDYFQLDGSLVVGTFGPLTESYVQQFQSLNGISPIGWVGPQTRAAIMNACVPVIALVASPTQGVAPLPVSFSYADPSQHMTYNIDYGDGSTGTLVYTVGTNCGTACAPRYDALHTYAQNGTYTALLTQVTDPCAGQSGCTTPAQVSEVGSATISVGQTTSDGSCVALTYNLSLDVTDAMTAGEVSKLQNFLIAGGYMQGSATGYFGPVTETAVQAYQKAKGIVSSGTAETTGYGYVGPKTRSVMAGSCGSSSGTSGDLTLTRYHSSVGNATHWFLTTDISHEIATGWTYDGSLGNIFSSSKATSDMVPLLRAYRRSDNDHFYTTSQAEMDNAIAKLGYGAEGSPGYIYPPNTNLLSTVPLRPLYRAYVPSTGQHFYTTDKNEFRNLPSGYGDECIAGYLPAPAGTPLVTGDPCAPLASFSATPQSGSAPLSVSFASNSAGTVEFGDGASAPMVGSPSGAFAITHTYSSAGSYLAKLTQGSAGVTCTGVTYDPNNALSFLNLGSTCTNTTVSTVVDQLTITVR